MYVGESQRDSESVSRSDPCIYHHLVIVKASIDNDILTGFSTVLFLGPASLQNAPFDCA